jgi:uncharacterized membrane protein
VRNPYFYAALAVYPLAIHGLLFWNRVDVAVGLLVGMSLLVLGQQWLSADRAWPAAWITLYGVLVLLGGINLYSGTAYALYLPPLLINLGLLAWFGASLRRGDVPVVERLMRLAYPQGLPPGLAVAARRMTWVWVTFFFAMSLSAVVLAHYASLRTWSWFVNVLYFIFIALLLLAQHGYRQARFGGHGALTLRRLARELIRIPPRDPAHPLFGGGHR